NATPLPKIVVKATHATLRNHLLSPYELKVEFLGTGQQFVAYGIPPDTQRHYEWTDISGAEPLCTPVANLPEVTPEQIRECCRVLAEQLTALGFEVKTPLDVGASRAKYSSVRRSEKVPVPAEQLRDVLKLSKLDPSDRGDWIKGMAACR